MDEHRLKYEAEQINDAFTTRLVTHGDPPYLRIMDIPTPVENWKTATTTLAIKLPADYPYTAPRAFVPSILTPRDGVKVKHKIPTKSEERDAFPGGPYHWFCLENLDWDPNRHGIATILRLFRQWLKTPGRDTFWENEITA